MLILLETMAEERRTATAPELLEPLMARLAGGDQEALAELYHRTRTSVYGLALSYLKNQHDAEAAENPMVTVEDRQVLDAALTALADDERQIVLLHAVTGWKHREIAGLLELPLSTVLSKYRRALLKLKTKLEGGDAL